MTELLAQLWEILVPQAFNDGAKIDVSYHNVWDEKVREIAGGLTILRSATGVWTSPGGEIFREKMIPVRIICSKEQIDLIVDMTMDYYRQKAILACRISDYVILKHRGDT
jgi:hypothetical protein